MIDGADSRLLSVVVRWKKIIMHGLAHLRAVIVQAPVFFLINGFQLGVEETEDRIAESFGLYEQELVHRTGGDVFFIYRLFYPGVRIGALSADVSHHLIIL